MEFKSGMQAEESEGCRSDGLSVNPESELSYSKAGWESEENSEAAA
jgi:hypothetical protein